ncbi:MAG: hypothetical protein Q4G23_11510, partial [Clostridia bacterium]|nr:hypothetical protein [Clostridia bacterium]
SIYKSRLSKYNKYNERFSEVMKESEKPFRDATKKKTFRVSTVLLLMLWILSGVLAIVLVMKHSYISYVLVPVLLLLFTFPLLLIEIGIVIAIAGTIMLAFASSKAGSKRTILKIRKNYKIED